jgi:septum formation protein
VETGRFLAADTIVLVDGTVLGKPADADDAKRMLRRLSGREHTGNDRRLSGDAASELVRRQSQVERTVVELAALSEEDIAWYVASGEPMDKAGAYAIRGSRRAL